ncbi:MAG: flagellar export protein FliJ [Clostridiales bacterium]|nr:flagellar export protein FliJ [Clostridiales bacterium]
MKKFTFSLNALYEVKKAQKDRLQTALAAAEATYRAAVEKKANLENTLEDRKDEFESKASAGMTVSDLKGYAIYFEEMQERIKAAGKEVDRAFREVNQRRNELVSVFKEIKVLEKLYEKQHGEYLKDIEKSETKAVEDIVSYQVTDGQIG